MSPLTAAAAKTTVATSAKTPIGTGSTVRLVTITVAPSATLTGVRRATTTGAQPATPLASARRARATSTHNTSRSARTPVYASDASMTPVFATATIVEHSSIATRVTSVPPASTTAHGQSATTAVASSPMATMGCARAVGSTSQPSAAAAATTSPTERTGCVATAGIAWPICAAITSGGVGRFMCVNSGAERQRTASRVGEKWRMLKLECNLLSHQHFANLSTLQSLKSITSSDLRGL